MTLTPLLSTVNATHQRGERMRFCFAAILFCLGLLGCYRDDLKPAPDPVGVVASGSGEFCTLNPEDLEYPVKVLFVSRQ